MAFDIVSYLLGKECGISEVIPKKIGSFEIECSTESTTQETVGEYTVDGCWTHNQVVLVSIRDKEEKTDHFYGSDTIIVNAPITGATAFTGMSPIIYRNIDGVIKPTATSAGVFPSYINNQNKLRIVAKYSSTSYTIDGTFTVDVYLVNFIDKTKPY